MNARITTLKCTHEGIHGPDSEPGAVQRCLEETVALRVEAATHPQSEELPLPCDDSTTEVVAGENFRWTSRAVERALEKLGDELIPELVTRTIREAWEVGGPTNLVMDPPQDYGRSKIWDPEGIED